MIRSNIDLQVAEVTEFSHHLRQQDDRQLVIFYELIRKVFENDALTKQTREVICRLVISQSSRDRLASRGALSFYVPFVLRCFFILGDFSKPMLVKMQSLYPLISDMNIIEVLDCHFFFQQLFGYPKKLQRLLDEADTAVTNQTESNKKYVNAFKDANAANLEALRKTLLLPVTELKTVWKALPWIQWQFFTMKSIL
ncbi:hypothetical protein [Salinimonas lutimaris]|uniref:hypothetical protein n=1 Tax=Salinimonas lutimaris TaxID=914153 RepID=UPI0010C129AE|nr:hypothetical protein [Salinimonas lutimaris]